MDDEVILMNMTEHERPNLLGHYLWLMTLHWRLLLV